MSITSKKTALVAVAAGFMIILAACAPPPAGGGGGGPVDPTPFCLETGPAGGIPDLNYDNLNPPNNATAYYNSANGMAPWDGDGFNCDGQAAAPPVDKGTIVQAGSNGAAVTECDVHLDVGAGQGEWSGAAIELSSGFPYTNAGSLSGHYVCVPNI